MRIILVTVYVSRGRVSFRIMDQDTPKGHMCGPVHCTVNWNTIIVQKTVSLTVNNRSAGQRSTSTNTSLQHFL